MTINTSLAIKAICLVLAFSAGWCVCSWREGAKQAKSAEKFSVELAKAEKKRDELAEVLAKNDEQHRKEMEVQQNETKKLRDDVARGAVRLRVRAACPSVSQAAAGASVDTGAGATLDPVAESDYYALRDAIARTEGKLRACQDQLKERAGMN